MWSLAIRNSMIAYYRHSISCQLSPPQSVKLRCIIHLSEQIRKTHTKNLSWAESCVTPYSNTVNLSLIQLFSRRLNPRLKMNTFDWSGSPPLFKLPLYFTTTQRRTHRQRQETEKRIEMKATKIVDIIMQWVMSQSRSSRKNERSTQRHPITIRGF